MLKFQDVILSNQMKLKVVELKDLSLYFDRGSYLENEMEEGLKVIFMMCFMVTFNLLTLCYRCTCFSCIFHFDVIQQGK